MEDECRVPKSEEMLRKMDNTDSKCNKVSKTNTDNTNLETGIDTKCYGRISILCPFN
jgi:hypothetical protein